MRTITLLITLGLTCLLAGPAEAQFGDAGVTGKMFTRIEGDQIRIAIQLEIPPEAHLFHTDLGDAEDLGQPMVITLAGEGVTWKPIHIPKPEKYYDKFFKKEAPVHYGQIVIHALGKSSGSSKEEISVEIKGQYCTEGQNSACFPVDLNLTSLGKGEDALFADFPIKADAPDAVKKVEKPKADAAKADAAESGAAAEIAAMGLWEFLLLAVGAGFFALLMPCTYPMIPITISFFTKQAADRGGHVLPLSLTYGIGIVAIYVLIGVIVGEGIVKFAAHWSVNLGMGLIFIVFALSLFGMYELRPPGFLLNMAGSASMRGGYFGVFLMGAFLVVTSFTCTMPFVGLVLAAGAATGKMSTVVLGMGAFGATMALPFVILSLLPGKLPQSGEWMTTIKVTLGFIEVAAALKFFSNVDLVMEWQILPFELFMWMWAGLFGITGAFLFGWIRMKGATGEIGPGQLSIGVVVIMFAIYCGYGATGGKMDKIMIAIAPPYSGLPAASAADGKKESSHTIIKDGFGEAVERAKAENKKVLVNFTGII